MGNSNGTKIDNITLAELFKTWENVYPVEQWRLEDIDLWPLVKKQIFFSVFGSAPAKANQQNSFFGSLLNSLKKKLTAWKYWNSLKLKQSEFLFSSADEQRISYENKKYNRFLDPMLDYLEERDLNSYFLEFGEVKVESAYKSNRIISLPTLIPLFARKLNGKKVGKDLDSLPGFKKFASEVNQHTGLDYHFIQKKIFTSIQSVVSWANLFEALIKKTKARHVVGLVYYTNPLFGMNYAADQLNVRSIDLQHGGQSIFHPCYYFSKFPQKGYYNILPKTFWNWDRSSCEDNVSWTTKSKHKVILGGNPWIGYLKNKPLNNIISERNKPVILYTIQPLNPMINEYFFQVIQNSVEQYDWWFRFHPRMNNATDREWLLQKLDEYKIRNKVIIEKATNLPLPEVLERCDLHISRYSGSISEAAMINRFSLIIDKVGKLYYAEDIKNGWAYSCLSEDVDIVLKEIDIILKKSFQLRKENNIVDFQCTINKLMTDQI